MSNAKYKSPLKQQVLKLQLFLVSFFIFLFGFTTLAVSLQSQSYPTPKNLSEYKVIKVIDGDTIEVEKLGKIRYIGINTPEIHHPTKGVETYGFEATLANKKLVEGKKVKLDFDVERKDRYGRSLAYVYVGSTFVNAYLVETGFAQMMTIPPNVKYANYFLKLQREAQLTNRGLWGKVSKPKQTGSYLGSIQGHTYHIPTCSWAKKIKKANQIWFDSKTEAEKGKYLPCKTCKP